MIKGCNKRVIVMKDTGNGMIEQAFFILKAEASQSGVAEGDILKQANRILEQSMCCDSLSRFSVKRTRTSGRERFCCLALGAVIGFAAAAGLILML